MDETMNETTSFVIPLSSPYLLPVVLLLDDAQICPGACEKRRLKVVYCYFTQPVVYGRHIYPITVL
jgi:hypothetical protein